MKTSIEIEDRMHNGKRVPCYIPKINGMPVMGEHSYILKESVNDEGKRKDNKELANFFLQNKIEEIDSFLKTNFKFINIKNNNL